MILGIALLILPILIIAFLYNSLIGKKNKVEQAFSSIDIQLKKRRDLIPNLVSTVKTFMEHEANLLTKLTQLRSQALEGDSKERAQVENEIGSLMGKITVAVENYPDLKSSEQFSLLQKSLNEVEEQIAASRRFHTSAITDYNNGIEMFPTNFIAKMLKYAKKEVFEISEPERSNIDVKELFNS